MATTLRAENFGPANIKAFSQLDADAAAGASAILVKSYTDLANNDYAFFGDLGSLTCEVVQLTNPTAVAVSLASALRYQHKRFESITTVKGNQIKVYRAPVVGQAIPADSVFQANLVSTVAIDADRLYTDIPDNTGGAGFWYKFTYFNSITSFESDISASNAGLGADDGHYETLDNIRQEAGLTNANAIPDTLVALKRQDAEAEVRGMLSAVFSMPLVTPTPPLIQMATRMIAAGMLMLNQYGIQPTGSSKDGDVKLVEGRDLLERIQGRMLPVVDMFGNQLAYRSIINGWPNDSTATYNSDNPNSSDPYGGDRRMRISGKTF